MAERTAGIIIIGNEILSGKVADENSPFLAAGLRRQGVELRRIVTVPDEVDLIGKEVLKFSQDYDYVFTSGGVGPTHDDVTIEGIAHGLGREVVRHPEIEAKIREFRGAEIKDAELKMAEVPEGAVLIEDRRLGFPTLTVENIYIFPGIPELLRRKFEALEESFASNPFHLRVIYTLVGEGELAEHLNQTLREFPEVALGSYPKIGDPEYRVKLTIESKDESYTRRAFDRLIELLTEEAVVRTE